MEKFFTPGPKNNSETTLFQKENWPQIKDQMISLVKDCFPQYQFTDKKIEDLFTVTYGNDNALVVLLKDELENVPIGFTAAYVHGDIAHIHMTGIRSDKRGQKLIGELMAKLEQELKNKNVHFIIRQARINDGYADAIERHYGERVVEKRDIEGTKDGRDPKRRIKIRL